MASFSKTIFEDEFFGHTKGAYTDAGNEKIGFFEAANGGTLFLDEIGLLCNQRGDHIVAECRPSFGVMVELR